MYSAGRSFRHTHGLPHRDLARAKPGGVRRDQKGTRFLTLRPFDKNTTIGFIGAGAVGGSLSLALHRARYPVVAVASRTQASAETFASRIPGLYSLPQPPEARRLRRVRVRHHPRRRHRPGLRIAEVEAAGKVCPTAQALPAWSFSKALSSRARWPVHFTRSRRSRPSRRAPRTSQAPRSESRPRLSFTTSWSAWPATSAASPSF